MLDEQIIQTVALELEHLHAIGFTCGFEDTVTHRVRDRVWREHGEYAGWQVWSACCIPNAKKLTKHFGEDLARRYMEVHNYSESNSRFVMPEWGTRGT